MYPQRWAAETYETTLEAKGKAENRIEDLFPGLTKGFLGYAIVRGDYDVSAVELLVTEDSMAALNGQRGAAKAVLARLATEAPAVVPVQYVEEADRAERSQDGGLRRRSRPAMRNAG